MQFTSIAYFLAANARNEDPDISLQEFKSFKGSYDHSTDTSGASGDGLLSDFGM